KHMKYDRTYDRKMQEIILSMAIEEKFTKQQIVEAYLNHVFFGNQSYGVKSAARNYFDKDLSELTLAECALLAGLPQSPSKYNPSSPDPEKARAAKARRDSVLNLLLDQRFDEGFFDYLKKADPDKFGSFELTKDEVRAALNEPIEVKHQRQSGE